MKFGDLVRRVEDPVHVGRVVRVVSGKVSVRWLGAREVLEFAVPAADLEAAEDWKAGSPVPIQGPFIKLAQETGDA